MRNTNINSSTANAIARFVNAGADMLFALLPEQLLQRLQHSCASLRVYPQAILPGNSGASLQVQLLTGTVKPEEPAIGTIGITASYLLTFSDRIWQMPGSTRRQTRMGKS